MSGVEVLHRKSKYVVEWAEHETDSARDEDSVTDPELAAKVRFRIEGVRRIEPREEPATDHEAMLGEPPF